MSWFKRQRSSDVSDALQAALVGGNPADIDAALLAAAPRSVSTLDAMVELLDDEQQKEGVRYWLRSRWGRGGESRALEELRRVFARPPQWRQTAVTRDKLPPLYPD